MTADDDLSGAVVVRDCADLTVGRHSGDVHIRITKDGFVPTVTEPWVQEEDRQAFISKAEQILSDRVWRD